MKTKGIKTVFIWSILLLVFSNNSIAQLNVQFTSSRKNACADTAGIVFTFTNNTQNASAQATYLWDFGNGVKSTRSGTVGTTYITAGKYAVQLTVTDGAAIQSFTDTITIFANPKANFIADRLKGCAPVSVNFTPQIELGDAPIDRYFWSLGGENRVTTDAQLNYTYTSERTYTVGLTVVDQNGCQSLSEEKQNYIEIFPQLSAAFTPSNKLLCSPNETITLNNQSFGPGNVTYEWSLGDNSTSTMASPTHSYTDTGRFAIQLIARNDMGCLAVANDTIIVAAFRSKWEVNTDSACTNAGAVFTNTSDIAANNTTWYFSDDNFQNSFNGNSFTKLFTQSGTYSIRMVNQYGSCLDTAAIDSIKVFTAPNQPNITISDNLFCGVPLTVRFSDTTQNVIKWEWIFSDGYMNDTTGNAIARNINIVGNYTVNLKVSDANGCTNNISKSFNIGQPPISIGFINSNSNLGLTGCEGLTIRFTPINRLPSDTLISVRWQFGDTSNTVSTDMNPQFTFLYQDTFRVQLQYQTQKCQNSVARFVTVYKKPKADFSIRDTVICGGNPVYFLQDTTSKPDITFWKYEFIKNTSIADSTAQDSIRHYFRDSGYYTIKMVAFNNSCQSDTITKLNYVYVKQLFIDSLLGPTYTCNNTRGLVTMQQKTRFADKWTWDFGDGNTVINNSDIKSVTHNYTKSGIYKIRLTITGAVKCEVKDSVFAAVLLKQTPQISIRNNEVCLNDSLKINISNLDTNYLAVANSRSTYYTLNRWEYANGSTFNGTQSKNSMRVIDSVVLKRIPRGQQRMRLILDANACKDTSNYIDVFVKGPIAGSIVPTDFCFKNTVSFQDTSKPQNNVPIRQWIWNLGDGRTRTLTTNGNLNYRYTNPGSYWVKLRIVDADGCFDTTNFKQVRAIGSKANFNFTPSFPQPFDNVVFNNTTNNFGNSNNNYNWNFAYNNQTDNTTNYNQTYTQTYPTVLTDTVRLIVSSNAINCNDTIVKLVPIRMVAAAFEYNLSYLNPDKQCPPILISLNSTSARAQSIKWFFGDGDSAVNINPAGHQFTKPGSYQVTLIAYGANSLSDTAREMIVIEGPTGELKAQIQANCSKPIVRLDATTQNTSAYTWDFGDGSILNTKDSFVTYQYADTGYFAVSVILTDSLGCTNRIALAEKVLSDSIQFIINDQPLSACLKQTFQPTAQNTLHVANNYTSNNTVNYQWNFGTGNAADTANGLSPSFIYNTPGNYNIKLTATTATGCTVTKEKTIEVKPITDITIIAPSLICEKDSIQFTHNFPENMGVTWQWEFPNGNTNNNRIPPKQLFPSPQTNSVVNLYTNWNGCLDTATLLLTVNRKPQPNVQPKNSMICIGQSQILTATDGATYEWLTNYNISNTQISAPRVTPVKDTMYVVKVTNTIGCSEFDTAFIKVTPRLNLSVLKDTFTCPNIPVPLRASGAAQYQWINTTAGLSNTQISNPTALPTGLGTTTYTLVAKDAVNCFSDTIPVRVTLHPSPATVSGGIDLSLPVGTSAPFITAFSNDVRSISWQPATYLSCNDCAIPTVTPRANQTYIVTGTTQFGCKKTDTVNVTIRCVGNTLSLPSGFTPENGDQLNNRFYPMGRGIRQVNHFIIYNRLGVKVFERSNFAINDRNMGWDGRYKGEKQPPGTFVYFIDATCDTGDVLTTQGTITLIR